MNPATAVDVGWFATFFAGYIEPALGVLVTGIIGWLAAILKSKWNLDIEASHRAALQTALTNAAALLIQKGVDVTKGKMVDVSNPIIAAAVKYVQDSAADALAHFKLSPADIAEKIAAKLPQVAPPVAVAPDVPAAA